MRFGGHPFGVITKISLTEFADPRILSPLITSQGLAASVPGFLKFTRQSRGFLKSLQGRVQSNEFAFLFAQPVEAN